MVVTLYDVDLSPAVGIHWLVKRTCVVEGIIIQIILTARCRSPNSKAQYLARSSDRLSLPAEADLRRVGPRGAARRGGGAPGRGGFREMRSA